jgi:FkbM family methyltransferase
MRVSRLISLSTKALFRQSQFAARCISFLLTSRGEYPVFVRRSRWLKALARKADWSQLEAYVRDHRVNTPTDVSRLGGEYGGYLVPVEGLDTTWIAYSFGVGEDISFEKALIDRYHCQVHAFDPTPRAIEFAAKVASDLPGFHFHPYGVGEVDGTVRFYAPRNPRHVSYSESNIQGTEAYLDMEVRTLQSIQSALGHERIDLLKMNIEGSELGVFQDIAKRQVEIPIIIAKLEAPVPFSRYKETLDSLNRIGYRPVIADGSAISLVHAEAQKARL